MKQIDTDEMSGRFIKMLSSCREAVGTGDTGDRLGSSLEELGNLFFSFAIVDEFTGTAIIDCYNEIRISIMEMDTIGKTRKDENIEYYRNLLGEMLERITDLYHYEIFGFFSTTIHPDDMEGMRLPCRIFFGCLPGWEKEPCVMEDGSIGIESVIRFEQRGLDHPLCMTVRTNPGYVGKREECSLNDGDMEKLRSFVSGNLPAIMLHGSGIIDSAGFLSAIRLNSLEYHVGAKYRIEFLLSGESAQRYGTEERLSIYMDDMDYGHALRFFGKVKGEISCEELQEPYGIVDFHVLPART